MELREQLQASLGPGYAVGDELARGGMSLVFVARDVALRRDIVVKVLRPELSTGVNIERFRREILLAAQLQHPHIVPLVSAGEMGGMPYYTMPLVRGESLLQRIARDDTPTLAESAAILRDVAIALAYAHKQGVVHRDIKPANVLLAEGSAVVADFGIAKALAAARDAGSLESSPCVLTADGYSPGTPAYMAPEQAAGDPATDRRADLYAFGVMAYELLSGRLPFEASSPHALLAMHLTDRPTPLLALRADVPSDVAAVVMQCLEKDPAARPSDAGVLVRMFESLAYRESPTPLGTPEPATLQTALALYCLCFVLVTAVTKAAITSLGLPDWVFPGALVVMGLGLPAVLLTGYVQHLARRDRPLRGWIELLSRRAFGWATWSRAAWGGAAAIGGFGLIVLAAMVSRTTGIGPFASLISAGRIKASDSVLVADLVVNGPDSGLGPILADEVRTGLRDSKDVRLVSQETIDAALGRMRRPIKTPLQLAIATEIAQREGIKAIVDGRLTPIGRGFVVTLRLLSSDSGGELTSVRRVAAAPTDVIDVLDDATRRLRARIGESLKDVRATPALSRATTSSIEALRLTGEANRLSDNGDYAAGAAKMRQAVALDPEYATGWRMLSAMLKSAMAPRGEVDSASAMAYRYSTKLPDIERLGIAAGYFTYAGRDRARMIASFETLLTRFGTGHNNLARQYSRRRDWTLAESLYRSRMRSPSPGIQLWVNILDPLIAQGHLAEAHRMVAEARSRFRNGVALDEWEWSIYYSEGKTDTAFALLHRAAANPIWKTWATTWLVHARLRAGRVSDADQMTGGPGSDTLTYVLRQARFDIVHREHPQRAVARLDSALTRFRARSDSEYLDVVSLYAQAGSPRQARALLDKRKAELQDTVEIRYRIPQYHRAFAEILIAENRGLDAVGSFLAGDRWPDGPVDNCPECPLANVWRAYERAGEADSMIAVFDRYVKTPSWQKLRTDAYMLARMHARLGQIHEQRGEREKAVEHYTAFVEQWANADQELQPRVREIRARLLRLARS